MTVQSRKLTFRLVTEQSELFSIVSAWKELIQSSTNPQPMNDPTWLLLWWRHYGARVDLAVGLLYEGDTLVGLAPMCLRNYVYRFSLVFRRLQFMGLDANERDGVFSEYMGFVARAGYEATVAREFVDLMAERRFGAWHELVLGAIDADSQVMVLAQAHLAERGLSCKPTRSMTGYYIKLPSTWDGYLRSLSSSRRYRIRNSISNFVEWAGDKGWALHHATSPQSFKYGYETLIALHQARWGSDGGSGVFSSPRFAAFHSDYIAAQAQSQNVDLAWLTVGNEPIAAVYMIRNGKKVLAYQYGRVMNTPTKVRVGITINALVIKEAIERGDEEFDFLGGESRYKVDFATDQRPIVTLRAARSCAREFLRIGLVNARDSLVSAVGASKVLSRRMLAARPDGRAVVNQADG